MCILLDVAIFDLGIYNSAILALVQKYVFAMTFSTLFLIQKIETNIVVSQWENECINCCKSIQQKIR